MDLFYHKITKNLIPQKDFTYFVPYAKGVTLFEVLPCYKFHEVASLNFRGKKLPTEISHSLTHPDEDEVLIKDYLQINCNTYI